MVEPSVVPDQAKRQLSIGTVVSSLKLSVTPIAMGSLVQHIHEWHGAYGWLVHLWSVNVRAPVQTLFQMTIGEIGIHIPQGLTDYLILSALYGSQLRSAMLSVPGNETLFHHSHRDSQDRLGAICVRFLSQTLRSFLIGLLWPLGIILGIGAVLARLFVRSLLGDLEVWYQSIERRYPGQVIDRNWAREYDSNVEVTILTFAPFALVLALWAVS